MAYRLVYHPDVIAIDLTAINTNLVARITRGIQQRLTAEPTYYGEALRHQLKGYWKLRIGDYRVIYKIIGQEVWIYRIGHRRDVYTHGLSRLTWHPS